MDDEVSINPRYDEYLTQEKEAEQIKQQKELVKPPTPPGKTPKKALGKHLDPDLMQKGAIIFALTLVSVLIWSAFVPIIDFGPTELFKLSGEQTVQDTFFNLNTALFLILSPMTYGLVAALGLRNSSTKGFFEASGITVGMSLSSIFYAWPVEYVLTGIAYGLVALLVFKTTNKRAGEYKTWIHYRASAAGAAKGLMITSLVFTLLLGVVIVQNQEVYFQSAITNALGYSLPQGEDAVEAQTEFSGLCIDLVGKQLSADTPPALILEQLQNDPTFLALQTDELRQRALQQAVASNNTQKDLFIKQLDLAKQVPLPTDAFDTEAQVENAYFNLVQSSPIMEDVKQYFWIIVLIGVFTTLGGVIKFTVQPLSGVYGHIFEKLFKLGGFF